MTIEQISVFGDHTVIITHVISRLIHNNHSPYDRSVFSDLHTAP